jgi:hypothetical protein
MYNIAMKKSNNRNTRKTRKTKKRRVIYKRDVSLKNRKTNGGNALASGGYGCIFSPALKLNILASDKLNPANFSGQSSLYFFFDFCLLNNVLNIFNALV